ncbi:hypothetical protein E2C01_050996 [Portunus trituberculatus]|uniref:Uncharacterized protein n=1 Tax=Portunus trituberculatus TaxID=210409 RepID=A0A5B7GHL0_PORTR|nr:hypothetical protein [Portunus trituberculatus]
MGKHKNISGSREVADLAHETSSSGLRREGNSPPQVPPTAVSCSGSSEERLSAGLESLLMINTELLHSRNIADIDVEHILNIFDNHLENSVPKAHQIPPPRWFVAYYRNGRGNFIHASWYLAEEIGTIT